MQNPVNQQEEIRPIKPTILVGLGGTGREVITRIRRGFVQKYGSVNNFPIVGYFLVDTDETMQHYTPGLKNLRVDFSENEVYNAIVSNVSSYTHNPRMYPHISEWIYPNLADIGDMRTGASAIRPYGRLAFFVHQGNIRKNLTDALSTIRSPEKITLVAEKYNIQCGTGLSVYVICSLAGGTGSSMFLDTAFTLKDIAKTEGLDIEIVGFLVLPGLYGNKEKHLANGYAALKELEHHSRIHNFEVRYEPNGNKKIISTPPFDYCYLIHNENEANISVDFNKREDLFELLAESIFLDFSDDDFANHKRRIRVNFVDQLSEVYNPGGANSELGDQDGWCKRYMSLGFTIISYPADRIISCCAYKLAGKVFDDWGKLTDPQISVIGGSMSDFVYNPQTGNQGLMSELGVYENQSETGKHDILTWITRSGISLGMSQEIQNYANNMLQSVKNNDYEHEHLSLVDFLDSNYKLVEAKFRDRNQEPDPSRRGEYDRRMDSNIDVLLSGGMLASSNDHIEGLLDEIAQDGKLIRGKIYNQVAKTINNKILSSAHMIEALEAMRNYLGHGDDSYIALFKRQLDEQSDTGFHKRLKEYQDRIEKYKSNINQLFSERQRHYDWSGKLPWNKAIKDMAIDFDDARLFTVLNSYKEAFIAYFHTKLMIASRNKAIDVCKSIVEYIDEKLIPELKRVDSTIRALSSLAQRGSETFQGKIDVSLFQNIYDPEDIDNIYYPKGKKVNDLDFHSSEIMRRLTNMRPDQPSVTIVDLAALADKFSAEGILNTIVAYTRTIFESETRNVNIIESVYEKKYPEEQELKRNLFMRNTLNFGKCWIVIDPKLPNAQLTPNTHKSYIVGHHSDPIKQHIYNLFEDEIAKSRNTQIDPNIQFFKILDASKILISTEIAGFPLASFNAVRLMQEKYEAEYMKRDSSLHIDKNDYKYRDVVPVFDNIEIERLKDVRYCFVIGNILGVLKPRLSSIDSSIEYDFLKIMPLKEVPYPLGVEKKAKLTMDKNPETLREIKLQIMQKEGKILRIENGKYDPENFRSYYLTINWYYENIYPQPIIEDGRITPATSAENKILEKKLAELGEMYRRTWRKEEADIQWDQFRREAMSLSNSPDDYSNEVASTGLRVIKM